MSAEPTTPTTPSGYRWSSLTREDLTAWAALVNHLAVVDGTEEHLSAEDLGEELAGPGRDPERDTWAVWDGEHLVGFASVTVPPLTDHSGSARAYLGGGVHADHRGRGLGTALMDRAEARALELLGERHPGASPAHLSAGGGLEGSSAGELLAARGYAVVRYFDLLTRGLGDLPPVPAIEGVELGVPRPEDEEAVMLAHNEAFKDHWGSGPTDPERWHEHWASRSARPAVSTLARGRGGELDGQVLGYVLVGQWVDREAYVTILGTVPQARGRGIGAAALAHTLRLVADSGDFDAIELDVDSDSLTGATRLYDRLGFTRKFRTVAMRRPVTEVAG